jgi:hypothetical protein
MQVIHRLSVNASAEIVDRLHSLGIRVSPGSITLRLHESDERLVAVRKALGKTNILDMIETEFTEEEMNSADYLVLDPAWHWGYPMPADDRAYLRVTYDLREYCCSCGIGASQHAEFRFDREPAWGNRNILQLNWVFDEYFVKPDVWEKAFRPFGIPKRSVLSVRTGRVLGTVVQLDFHCFSASPLSVGDSNKETCSRCGRTRCVPHVRGFFPSPVSSLGNAAAFRTREWWGSGCYAARRIVISNPLYKSIRTGGVRGVMFTPLGKRGQPCG